MPHVRRIAQGLLFALTVSTVLPPMPAWALRQGAAAESDKTTAGLEEGLTGKPTTMNRRQFLHRASLVVGAGALTSGVGAAGFVAQSPTGPTDYPVLFQLVGQPDGIANFSSDIAPLNTHVHVKGTVPGLPAGTLWDPDGQGANVLGEFELRLVPLASDGGFVGGFDQSGVPDSMTLRITDISGGPRIHVRLKDGTSVYDSHGALSSPQRIDIPLAGHYTQSSDVRLVVGVSYRAVGDRAPTNPLHFSFDIQPSSYRTSHPQAIAKPVVAGVLSATATAVVGGLVARALAPADAEKVLGEYLDATVSDVKDITGAGQTIIVLVDPNVADRETVLSQGSRFNVVSVDSAISSIPGYPMAIVAPLDQEIVYNQRVVDDQPIIRVVAAPESGPLPIRKDTVYVSGLRGQRAGDLLPAVITESLARWQRVQDAGATRSLSAPIVFDITPYLALRDLTAERVWQVLYERFA